MNEEPSEITLADNWKAKAMIIGGVVGAGIGILGAYLLTQRSEENQPPEISVGEGVKLGVLVLTLLRNIANL